MIENAQVGQAVWVMRNNHPEQIWITEIATHQYLDRTNISYGIVNQEKKVGKMASDAYYSPDKLYESKDALLDSFR